MTKRELKRIAEDPATLFLLATSGSSLYTQETTQDLKELRIRYEALGVVIHLLEYIRQLHLELFPDHVSHDIFLRGFDGKISVGVMGDRSKRVAVVAEDMLRRIGIQLCVTSSHWQTIRIQLPKE
jgi:hypothetical protein